MTYSPLLPLDILLPLGLFLVAFGAWLSWRANYHCATWLRIVAMLARALGLAMLVAIAFNPGSWQPLEKEQPSGWAIMIDRSLSMAASEENGSRWQQAVELAEKAVRESHKPERVKIFTFASDLEKENDGKLSALVADGDTTDIVQSGRTLLSRWPSSGLHLNGILLMSDGRQIASANPADFAQFARAQGTAIFPLPIGTDKLAKDLSITPGRRQYFGFPGQKTKITALVRNQGYTRISPIVDLLDAQGKVVAWSELKLENESSATVALDYIPTTTGYQKFTLRVTEFPEENNLKNNTHDVGLLVLSEKTKIFLAEGSPTWDSKFLAQLFRTQPQLDVTAVFRLAADHYYRVSTDAAATANNSAEVFPSSAEEFGKYDIIVFGKGADYFLTPERADLLRSFVHDKGGCVIFSRGKSYDGEFAELESLEPVVWGDKIDAPFRLLPTEVGQEAGLFDDALRPESDVWKNLPLLSAANKIEQQKSFAEVMLDSVASEGSHESTFPAVISRRYGKGMVIAVNADGLWEWDFFSAARDAGNLYREFWTQLVQWAVTYSEFLPGQEYSVKLSETSVLSGTPVRVRIGSRGAISSRPPGVRLIRGNVTLSDLGQPQRIPDAAAWELFLTAPEAGSYAVELYNPADNKSYCNATLDVTAPPGEKDNLDPDPAFLQKLADNSGGRVISAKDIASVIRELEPEKRTLDESNARWIPLWSRGWLLACVLGLFTVEWIIRRRNGLL